MPRVRTKPRNKVKAESFEFTHAVCVEGFSAGWSDPIARGSYPLDHPMVENYPIFWRKLGPPIDDEEVST